ncbi:MAG: hypothetical protein ACO1NX_05175 [Chitinophagaceae bacterium]
MEEKVKEEEGFRHSIKKRIIAILEWVKPEPGDPLWLTILKSIYKGIAVLVLVALSPVIFLLLLIIFFATL